MFERRFALHYGALTFFNTILHNVFLVYHIETFVAVYRIDKTSFWIGETIFLLWNSLNDPLFGWISDRRFLSKDATDDVILHRLSALSRNGLLFPLSFLAFWGLWTYPSIQFVVCLCLYDSFLTMIDLHHSALLADLSVAASDRTQLNAYCSVFGALGSLSVFISHLVWDRNNLLHFQVFCVLLSVASVAGFLWSTTRLKKLYKSVKRTEAVMPIEDSKEETREGMAAMCGFVRQLSGHSNFVMFSVMNIVQVFHCHFNSNFFPLFLENLLGSSVSHSYASILLGVSFVAPHINNLYFLSLCRRYGVYAVIRMLFIAKLLLSVFMLLLGPEHTGLLSIFIASNRVFTEGTCKLLTLVISDLVDEDFVLHNRKQAVSALMFGSAALLSKPGQTLAPLIGTWLLSVRTGHDVFATGNEEGSMHLDTAGLDPALRSAYRDGIFTLVVYVPIVCACIQLAAWSQFGLHGKRLRWVKQARTASVYASV